MPLASLLIPFVLGETVADGLALRPPGLLFGVFFGAVLLGLRRGQLRRLGEIVLAGSLGALSLALRLDGPIPEPPAGPVMLTLDGVATPSPFDCRLPAYVHGASPGRALVRAPLEACAWLPGQQLLAHLKLDSLPPDTNPGSRDSRRRWARRGIHRAGRVREGRIAPVGPPPVSLLASLERGRRRVADALDPLDGGDHSGPLLRALIVGDRARLVDSVRKPFERSGTAHLLAVSGLHIGWAFALGRLLALGGLYPWPGVRLQRSRRRWAALVGLAVAAGYAVLAGLSVPTLRAAAMAAAGAVAWLGGRPAAGWNALAGAALLILAIDPAALFEASFGLSFLAVAGILLWRPRGSVVDKLVGCTLGASLATAPLLVHLGLPLPALGIVANLLLVPWFTVVVVPLGLSVAVLALLAPEGALLLGPLARLATGMGLWCAELFAGPDLLPASATPTPVAAVAAVAFAVRVALRREFRLACGIGLLAAALALTAGIAALRPAAAPEFEILFLDVGQGDATLVRSAGSAWLVDAGPGFGSLDAGRRVVLPALRAEAVGRLEVLVLTHADRDHVGGASAVLERLDVGEVWVPPSTVEDPSFRLIRQTAAARRVPLRIVVSGYEASLGRWRARVLWPPPGLRPRSRNDGGLIVRFEGRGGCAVLPADASLAVERELVGQVDRCALLKLGHHGSETSSGRLWLEGLDPEVAVASASRSRAEQFPGPGVRSRLRARDITLYETARFGAVRVRFADFPVVLPYRGGAIGGDARADAPCERGLRRFGALLGSGAR